MQNWERAVAETNRLQRDLDITNADHIALWLEANTIPDEPMSQCMGWLAVQIVEAHEAAIGRARNAAAVAIADEIIPDTADGETSAIQRQAYWHVAHRAALAALAKREPSND